MTRRERYRLRQDKDEAAKSEMGTRRERKGDAKREMLTSAAAKCKSFCSTKGSAHFDLQVKTYTMVKRRPEHLTESFQSMWII